MAGNRRNLLRRTYRCKFRSRGLPWPACAAREAEAYRPQPAEKIETKERVHGPYGTDRMTNMHEQIGIGRDAISRRRFLRGAGATLMLPHVVTASARGAEGRVAPGNRITVGIIGCGCMGRGHVRRMANSSEAQVLAVCDVDRLRVERAKVSVDQSQGHEAARGCIR